MTLTEFISAAEEAWNEIPLPLLDGLTGGLAVLAAAKEIPGPKNLVAMGEYHQDNAGRKVVLYYGSFRRVLEGERNAVWKERIRATVRHEIRHHIEARAGRVDLVREDLRQIYGDD